MKSSKLVVVCSGITLYAILVCSLLSTVYWRSACNHCALEETACLLHKAAAGLLLSIVVTCFVVPFFVWFWLRYMRCLVSWAYTILGGFLVVNATTVTAASTIVIIVEQFMCPSDKAVEFAAVVLIFSTQIFSGVLVEEIYLMQGEARRGRYPYDTVSANRVKMSTDEIRQMEEESEADII